MDYQITDPIIHPPGANEPLATEKLVRLPHIFACYRPPDHAPEVQPLPALSAGHVTFGYFNNLAKLRDSVLRAWALIAAKLPTARFVIQTSVLDDPAAHEIVTDRCLAAGMPRASLDIRGQSSLSRFHDDLNKVDIGLDPFPFNGHTTSCQMLYMGVPIVTLAGKTRSSRMGASLMCNLGLQHLVAHSPEEYADIALRLASDLPKLAAIRAGLRERMETSPVMNAPLYVRDLESAFRAMWQAACKERN
jgi:predicted O-linked N-acetylglucosamine transferase (SPINDLY family)